jgi:hypothetical protein
VYLKHKSIATAAAQAATCVPVKPIQMEFKLLDDTPAASVSPISKAGHKKDDALASTWCIIDFEANPAVPLISGKVASPAPSIAASQQAPANVLTAGLDPSASSQVPPAREQQVTVASTGADKRQTAPPQQPSVAPTMEQQPLSNTFSTAIASQAS